jgi:hypothetical protein
MEISPQLQRKIRKVLENKGDVALAQLESMLELGDKLEDVAERISEAVKAIPQVEIPETEYPSSIEVVNLPEVQKVQIMNHPKEKDDNEVRVLLKELIAEVKKKDEYAYDIEIDDALKAELKGKDGEPGERGNDGSPDTPNEVVEKVIQSEKRIPKSKIEGLDDVERVARDAFRDGISATTVKTIETRLQTQIDTKITGVNTRKLTVSPTAPDNPQLYDLWIEIP